MISKQTTSFQADIVSLSTDAIQMRKFCSVIQYNSTSTLLTDKAVSPHHVSIQLLLKWSNILNYLE